MKKLFVIISVIASLFVMPISGLCMDFSKIQFNAHGGLFFPDNDADMGFTLGGHALYPFIETIAPLSMGVSLDYSTAGGDADFSMIELMGIARYDFNVGQNLNFFAQAGVGVCKWEMEYDVNYRYYYYNRHYTVSADDTEFGISLGGGMKFMKNFGEADSFTVTVGYNF